MGSDFDVFLDRVIRALEAVEAIYYAGHWTCDRDVDAETLWGELRDALELTTPAPRPLNGK